MDIRNSCQPPQPLLESAAHIVARHEIGRGILQGKKIEQAAQKILKNISSNMGEAAKLIEKAHRLLEREVTSSKKEVFESQYEKWTDMIKNASREQEGKKMEEIQKNLDTAQDQMVENLAQVLNRSERLEVMEQNSDNIRATSAFFKQESEAVKLLMQPHVVALIAGIANADAQADLVEAQRKKQQAEINLVHAQEAFGHVDLSDEKSLQRVTMNLNAAVQDRETAEETIVAAQAKLDANKGLTSKEFFQILARDDIGDVIRELNLEGMQSLIRSVMEHLSNLKKHLSEKSEHLSEAEFGSDAVTQKVFNFLSSDDLWASLKSSMLIKAQDNEGHLTDTAENDIKVTIEGQREMCMATIAAVQAKMRTE
jgi:hypothetical protein